MLLSHFHFIIMYVSSVCEILGTLFLLFIGKFKVSLRCDFCHCPFKFFCLAAPCIRIVCCFISYGCPGAIFNRCKGVK